MADFTKEWIEHLKGQIAGRMNIVADKMDPQVYDELVTDLAWFTFRFARDPVSGGLWGSGGAGSSFQCSRIFIWLSQKDSNISVSGNSCIRMVAVHGFTNAFGSSMVISTSMCPMSLRR